MVFRCENKNAKQKSQFIVVDVVVVGFKLSKISIAMTPANDVIMNFEPKKAFSELITKPNLVFSSPFSTLIVCYRKNTSLIHN